MGLDMYGCITKTPVGDVDFNVPEDSQEIVNWCKHPNLHGWMAQRYYDKGGTDESFNGNTLRLDPDDIDALETALDAGVLPVTFGFFFGESYPEYEEDDRAFIAAAREALAAGFHVFYDSWW